MAGTRFGGQAELVTVPEVQALPLPERLSFEQGAAFPVNYGTAYAALIVMGSLREGDRLLIHAAAGGVGIAATQIASNVGAEIFGTASPSKHDAIRAQGVKHAIDYRNQDFEAGGDAPHRRRGRRPDHRRARPDLLPQGLPPAPSRRADGHVRAFRDDRESGRNIPATLKGLAKMPLATIPWWKSLALMNENKGVFGLNMLKWWEREGSLDRVTEPLMADLEAGAWSRSSPRLSPSSGPATRTNSSPSAATSARSCCFQVRRLSKLGRGRLAMKRAILIMLAILAAQTAAVRARRNAPTRWSWPAARK